MSEQTNDYRVEIWFTTEKSDLGLRSVFSVFAESTSQAVAKAEAAISASEPCRVLRCDVTMLTSNVGYIK